MKSSYLIIIILVLVGGGCSKTEKQEEKPEPFLTVSRIVQDEIARLEVSAKPVKKIITINDKTDSMILSPEAWTKDTNFWEKEFALFQSFEAKPSWSKLYRVEKPRQEMGIISQEYTQTDSTLPVESLILNKKNDKVQSIIIRLNDNKNIYQSNKTLILIPGKFLRITNFRKTLITGNDIIEYTIYF